MFNSFRVSRLIFMECRVGHGWDFVGGVSIVQATKSQQGLREAL
jgi:hypothetical protein